MSDKKIAILDLGPVSENFREQVISGLSHQPRTLPCKFFYDEAGSALFSRICELPEYYITRTEMRILRDQGGRIAAALGPGIELIGLGTGAGTKTRLLLEHLDSPTAYVPVDISREQLRQSTVAFSRRFPSLEILPVCTDYLQPFDLPAAMRTPERKVVYFPGSTIGNLEPSDALAFLCKVRLMAGTRGGLLMGVDLKKSKAILERAYNDSGGITAQFNLNLLTRINRELAGTFDPVKWRHVALYNSDAGRIEMHLVSQTQQTVLIGNNSFVFGEGEHIITEYSYKYSPEEIIAMAGQAKLRIQTFWTDPEQLFGLFLFAVHD